MHGVPPRPDSRSEEDSEEGGDEGGGKKVKRRVSLAAGYLGTNYVGSQWQSDLHMTIDKVLEEAIAAAGGIGPRNRQCLSKIGWSRASRTDRGVHSASYIVSFKMLLDAKWLLPPDPSDPSQLSHLKAEASETLLQKLNASLPNDVRAFEVRRQRSSFLARADCNYRRYEYLLPLGVLTWRAPACVPPLDTPSPPPAEANLSSEVPSTVSDGHVWRPPHHDPIPPIDPFRQDPEHPFDIDSLRRLLQHFEGTHYMHNYTAAVNKRQKQDRKRREKASRQWTPRHEQADVLCADNKLEENTGTQQDTTEPEELCKDRQKVDNEKAEIEAGDESGRGRKIGDFDPTLVRTVYQFDCEETVVEGKKFVRFTVGGQSFVLHQIRMMVGMVVAVQQGWIQEDLIEVSLNSPIKIRVPIVPGSSLILDSVSASFNEKAGQGAEVVLMSAKAEQEARLFKENVIYPHVASLCLSQPNMEQWLKFMHTYRVTPEQHDQLLADYELWRNQEEERKQKRESVRADMPLREGRVLPKGLMTKLCTEFGQVPTTLYMADVIRALEDVILRGALPATASVSDFIAFVKERGLKDLADAGRRIRTVVSGAENADGTRKGGGAENADGTRKGGQVNTE
eukprot:CAMPEP_0184661672 /NCGR_PEP_ID=MMETSP0308-20130426/39538_1 /TAXON_ID=38269 /ORGANISM="Gloeochaete witrockiana, Strain SAG 46.84" /LENGTH=622 /DNA_ID=CAMNT_0027103139 /DNA_START=181 /DNA_END=2049 /DNA_ORIENTATION=+